LGGLFLPGCCPRACVLRQNVAVRTACKPTDTPRRFESARSLNAWRPYDSFPMLTRQEIARTEAAGHRGEAGARMPCGRAERGRTHDDLLAFLLGAAYADCPK
jgi:hypothetical protein